MQFAEQEHDFNNYTGKFNGRVFQPIEGGPFTVLGHSWEAKG
jgi:hypothetical protein